MNVNVVDKGEYLMITAVVNYNFEDYFIIDKNNSGNQIFILDRIKATPFYIKDKWSTRIDAIIKKDS